MRDQLSHQITLSMRKERLCITEVKEVLEAASWILLFRGHQTEEAKELHTEATKVIQAHQQLEFWPAQLVVQLTGQPTLDREAGQGQLDRT
jgi:hypothetical protein